MPKHVIQTNMQLNKAIQNAIVFDVLHDKTHPSLPPAWKATETCNVTSQT